MRRFERSTWLGLPLVAAAAILTPSASLAGTVPARLEASPAASKAVAELPPAFARSGLSDNSATTAPAAAIAGTALAHAGTAETVALARPTSSTDEAARLAAAHPITAATLGGASQTASSAHMEATASQMATTARVASLAPTNATPLLAHSADGPDSSGAAIAPDRSGVKPEAILPSDRPGTTAAKPVKKSNFKAIRTAFAATGPRSKANSIRNRIWLKHAPN
jgi:hypothetical protein